MNKLLLVDLDKDYIRRTENGSEFSLTKDLFTEAVDNLRKDIEGWSANSGLKLTLDCKNEYVIEELDTGQKITRAYTRVYGVPENEDDLAWISMSLGNIKPARRMTRGEYRGWQFSWG